MKVDFEVKNLKIGWKIGLFHSVIKNQRFENGIGSNHYYHF